MYLAVSAGKVRAGCIAAEYPLMAISETLA
jgi:hypothetical protein